MPVILGHGTAMPQNNSGKCIESVEGRVSSRRSFVLTSPRAVGNNCSEAPALPKQAFEFHSRPHCGGNLTHHAGDQQFAAIAKANAVAQTNLVVMRHPQA